MPSAQFKDFIFTINNYTDEELVELCCIQEQSFVQYMCYGKEVGPECGTPHIHVMICFKKKKTIGGARALMPKRAANFEPRKGTPDECRNYCKKDGDFVEFGEWPHKQVGEKRARDETDYGAVIDAIKDGQDLKTIVASFPEVGLKNFASLKAVYGLFQPLFSFTRYAGPFEQFYPYSWDKSKSLILIGKPGIGKTQWALNEFENPMLCRNLNALRAFDCNLFDGLVIDDCDFTGRPRSDVLNILEVEQPCSFRVLYGVACIPAGIPRIFCFNPGYEAIDFTDPAVRRRCHIVRINDFP